MIINATNIGEKLTGIGRYSLSVCSYLLENWDYPFKLYINQQAVIHFKELKNLDKIITTSKFMSPDAGFKGQIYRTFWSNVWSLKNRKELIFNTSPIESSAFHKKQIVTFHDVIPLLFPSYHKKQYLLYTNICPMILKNAVRIIAVSQNTKNLISDIYKIPEEKITVIHNGISESFSQCEPDYDKENYILYVGRGSPMKNIDGLIKAFEILITRHKLDIKLKLLGKGIKINSSLPEHIAKRIEKIEYIDNESELIAIYKKALLLALVSFHEGFGIPPIEAMACGCPTIVSNISSLPEVCGDASCYVDPHDIENIAERMNNIICDENLRKKLIEKGLHRAKTFSWENSAKQHIKVFEEVINTME